MSKKLWSFVLAFLFVVAGAVALNTFAAKQGSPFQPHDDQRFSDIESLADGGLEVADGSIIVGDASGNGNVVAMSGDATIINTGALTIAAGAVEETMLAVPTADGLNAMRVARATFDCTGTCAIGATASTVTLPANSIVTQVYFRIETLFVDAGAGTVSFSCEDSENLLGATDFPAIAAGVITAGIPIGTAATMVDDIAAPCALTLDVLAFDQTAGVVTLYVQYVTHD
jgi:hypothetical protein